MTDENQQVALYQRYRPMQFRQLVGQEDVRESLRISVADGNVNHAYLFAGEHGCGKTSAANIFARAVNCLNPVDEGEPCNECASCESILARESLSVVEYDAATHSGVDAIRNILETIGTVTSDKRKFIILDEAHLLSPSAEAALLITMQDPPPNVTFILCSTDIRSIGKTILSRCQLRNFLLISPENMTWWLGKINEHAELELSAEQIQHAVLYGQGSARKALSGLEAIASGIDLAHYTSYGILEAMVTKDSLQVLTAAAESMSRGTAPRDIAESLFTLLRECFFITMGASELLATPDWGKREETAKALGPKNITTAITQLGDAITGMQSGGDGRVYLEIALARYCAMAQ